MNTYVAIVEYDLAGSMAGCIAYAGGSFEAAKIAGKNMVNLLSHSTPMCTIQIWDNGAIAQKVELKDIQDLT